MTPQRAEGPPFEPDLSIMGVSCDCFRRHCRHKRDLERRQVEQRTRDEQLAALTDEDLAWLAEQEWQPPSVRSWIRMQQIRG